MSEAVVSPSIDDIKEAHKRVKEHGHVTPIFTSSFLNKLAGGKEVFLKAESFQKMGAFKFRGACNSVFKLTDEEAAKGVVTHSSGNHGQALALAAKIRGIKSYVVVPQTAPLVKIEAMKGYGANLVFCKPTLESRESTVEKVIKETGALFIHPYNNKDVIAGQATIALEILDQIKDLDAVIAPVGGGGLLSGVSLAAKSINPKIKVFGAEPKGADDAYQSLKTGVLVPQKSPNTIADGLRTSLGNITFAIIKNNVDDIITVSEDEIRTAMRIVWERIKIVIEPSSAVAVAAVLSQEFKNGKGKDVKKVGVVISGGNVDLNSWDWRLVARL
eukprot:TRINITY_DN2075_c0_g1_i1.p1 TRINITY_DN2075_c0_g1~~TRINITY_DN2075_c0_g1_i1.p1  ORF type:complete len:360 (-),score=86.74 TRINITY_DN2075_c0_g1_i1:76-1065(-)